MRNGSDRANERQRVSHASGAGPGAPASERAGGSGGAKPPGKTGYCGRLTHMRNGCDTANERQRVSHASGAGPGAPASERAGGSGGAKPPGKT